MRNICVVAKKIARNGLKMANSLGCAFHFESEFRYSNPATSTVSTPSPTTGLGGHSTFSPISSPRDTMASRMSSSSASTSTSGASSAAKYGGKKLKGITNILFS